MGTLILDMVVDLLNEGGLRAEAAQPAGNMTAVQSVVAAVSLEQVDQESGSVTVLVEMVGPAKDGGKRCQREALKAFEILRGAGGICRQEKCTFISKADMFCTPVTAVFYGTATAEDWQPRPSYEVDISGVSLPWVTGFSASQKVGEGETSLVDMGWEFTLEEYFPAGTEETVDDPVEPFEVTLSHGSRQETYIGCNIMARERVLEENGVRQVRRGTAQQRRVDQ